MANVFNIALYFILLSLVGIGVWRYLSPRNKNLARAYLLVSLTILKTGVFLLVLVYLYGVKI